MHVRLSVAWTDPTGVSHAAGGVVDIDAVTLAELEERGIVKDAMDNQPVGSDQIGPGNPKPDETEAAVWIGPGSVTNVAADSASTDEAEPATEVETTAWIGPGSTTNETETAWIGPGSTTNQTPAAWIGPGSTTDETEGSATV